MTISELHNTTIPMHCYVHLPGMFQSPKKNKLFEKNVSSGIMEINPELIEIITLRNTKNSPCDENTQKYDEHLIGDIFNAFGCKPYYYNSGSFRDVPICTSNDTLEVMNELLTINQDLPNYERYR